MGARNKITYNKRMHSGHLIRYANDLTADAGR